MTAPSGAYPLAMPLVAQISVGRSDGAESRAADRLEDKRGGFAVAGVQRFVQFLRELVAALVALIGAVVWAAIRIRRVDLGGVAEHGQVDLAAQKIATHRHSTHGRAVVALVAT